MSLNVLNMACNVLNINGFFNNFRMMAIQQQTLFQQELVQTIPYVSTDLRMIELSTRQARQQDMVINGISYRRLDAKYFVWIEGRMKLAQNAVHNGRLTEVALHSLTTRFEPIKDWVAENIDSRNLVAVRKLFENTNYSPPPAALPKPKEILKTNEDSKPESAQPYLYPTTGHWEYTVSIDPNVVKIIDSICDEAISKGWSEASLYQNRGHFIAGKWYGLICILDKTDRIERIDEDIIYIRTFKGSAVPPEGEIVKFPNLEYEERHASR